MDIEHDLTEAQLGLLALASARWGYRVYPQILMTYCGSTVRCCIAKLRAGEDYQELYKKDISTHVPGAHKRIGRLTAIVLAQLHLRKAVQEIARDLGLPEPDLFDRDERVAIHMHDLHNEPNTNHNH